MVFFNMWKKEGNPKDPSQTKLQWTIYSQASEPGVKAPVSHSSLQQPSPVVT